MPVRFKNTAALEKHRKRLQTSKKKSKKAIAVCTSGCIAHGADRLVNAFEKAIKKKRLSAKIELKQTGCHGFCERGPLVVINPGQTLYQQVKTSDIDEILEKTIKGTVVERLLYKNSKGKVFTKEDSVPFYKNQMRLLLGNNSRIDPCSIDDYIGQGGYRALGTVLSKLGPEKVIEQIKLSGLRGRGGGGFPAGVKWETCRAAASADDVRYIICNADEGDPGAFMDRALVEGNPHSVIEGMIIGAWAVGFPGKPQGYVYIRNEYPLAVERLNIALKQARQAGFLGKNILGSKLDFDIQVNRGGGAFVCGESTALMASIEGDIGRPRAKHIHTVEVGLHGKPSNLNNVETWANVPLIIDRGVKWYTSIGTGDVSKNPWGGSKGTKIFALVGKVNNTGLVEVPMGTTLRRIIYDIGEGIPNSKAFKAVQTGGPSGGCLPAAKLDVPVDFDSLTREGSMMGSGGMIVMDEDTCMVDVARYFVNFLKFESCGNCTSCRDGLERLHELLSDIVEGRGTMATLDLIKELAETIRKTSLCALGTSSVNPLISTLKHFRAEYEAHVKAKRCPAKVCKALITYKIVAKNCNGCTLCAKHCPESAIKGQKKKLHTITQKKCIKCGICKDVCQQNAVTVK
jgi:NADH-quinone oxidoreductase subunit F